MESANLDGYTIDNLPRDAVQADTVARLRLVQPLSPEVRINLLGAMEVCVDGHVLPALPIGSQRLLAFLALREHPTARSLASGTLWPDASDSHAHANLRSAILRLTRLLPGSVTANFHEVQLSDGVAVDIRMARDLAHRLLNWDPFHLESDIDQDALWVLSSPLLPDWHDEWALGDAETWRQLRLHALEAMGRLLVGEKRFGEAAAAALAAIHGEPLRETAHAALIRVYTQEGNRAEALAAYNNYRALLKAELGLEPTPHFMRLLPDA